MTERINYSIHPRASVPGFKVREKKNTRGNKSRAKIERAIAGITAHLKVHPRDAMSAARLAKLQKS